MACASRLHICFLTHIWLSSWACLLVKPGKRAGVSVRGISRKASSRSPGAGPFVHSVSDVSRLPGWGVEAANRSVRSLVKRVRWTWASASPASKKVRVLLLWS
jgi:hypothetical protein